LRGGKEVEEINWGTVIASTTISTITVFIVNLYVIKIFIRRVDIQTSTFIEQVKLLTLSAVKNS
jgi:TctA family transporter